MTTPDQNQKTFHVAFANEDFTPQAMSSEDGWFAGAMADRNMANLAFADFLGHTSGTDSQRQYNLAQAPMYSQDPGLAAPLAGLLPDIRIPSAMCPDESDVLHSINFWMAARLSSPPPLRSP